MNGGTSSDEEPVELANKLVIDLRECFVLLAIQLVTVTYTAGLNPPGGVWEETKDGHLSGNPILALTDHMRYNTFSYSNATALMVSAVVILFLFVRGEAIERPLFSTVLRTVMSLGTLALAVAYAAAASQNKFMTSFVTVLVAVLFLYVAIFTAVWIFSSHSRLAFSAGVDAFSSRSMLSAIFVASMAYTAGMSPPGAFLLDAQEGHRAGSPALLVHHRRRFTAFYIGNTMAFVASLFMISPILANKVNKRWLYFCNNIAQNGLWIAYAAGSSMETAYIAYVVFGGEAILPVMGLMLVIQLCIRPHISRIWKEVQEWLQRKTGSDSTSSSNDGMDPFFILMFTTLSAAVTYQAGLNPPGGLWLDDLDGHKAGDPILLAKKPTRYRVFIYCNSMALVASLVANVMALTKRCLTQRSRILDGLMVLDLIGLIGAYAAGCCRDVKTSINVISLGGAVVVYVVFHMAFLMSRTRIDLHINDNDGKVEADRDLMLGILGATFTYQTGLTPPGGFWQSDDEFGHHAGEPVLLSTYPTRYTVFFYLNAICFMASIFLTILFVNPLLYRAGIRCGALRICVLAVLLGLIGAYSAGSYRNLGPSIYIITLGAAVFILITSILFLVYKFGRENAPRASTGSESSKNQSAVKKHTVLEYLFLIGSIGTTVTYQAGFAPPRSFWPDDSNGHTVGNPALRDMDAHRYRIFFFCNTTSFAASSFIMNNFLMGVVSKIFSDSRQETAYTVLQAPVVVSAIGILGAYAAGSTSGWTNTTTFALALVAPVLLCIFLIDLLVNFVRWMRAKCIRILS